VGLWLRSAPHRELMLHADMRRVGIGRATGWFGGRPASVWVLRVGCVRR
jgi:hypothetical protein